MVGWKSYCSSSAWFESRCARFRFARFSFFNACGDLDRKEVDCRLWSVVRTFWPSDGQLVEFLPIMARRGYLSFEQPVWGSAVAQAACRSCICNYQSHLSRSEIQTLVRLPKTRSATRSRSPPRSAWHGRTVLSFATLVRLASARRSRLAASAAHRRHRSLSGALAGSRELRSKRPRGRWRTCGGRARSGRSA